MPLCNLTLTGDLPPGIHRASLSETLARFAEGTVRRQRLGRRLERICHLAQSTGAVGRFIVFGSFITAKLEPNHVDIFLLMEDSFDASTLHGETQLLFDHAIAQAHFGASVFWQRRLSVFGDEETALSDWGIKRDGGVRGIVEIVPEEPQ